MYGETTILNSEDDPYITPNGDPHNPQAMLCISLSSLGAPFVLEHNLSWSLRHPVSQALHCLLDVRFRFRV